MKKFAALFFVCAMLGAAGSAFADAAAKAQHLKKTAFHFPNGEKIMVEVADTPQERETGLMFRKTLPKKYGMLFVFPQQLGLEFWMKNTWAALDIVYISSDKAIAVIHADVPASSAGMTDEQVAKVWGTGQYVLELPAGTSAREGFKVGQKFRFKASIPVQ